MSTNSSKIRITKQIARQVLTHCRGGQLMPGDCPDIDEKKLAELCGLETSVWERPTIDAVLGHNNDTEPVRGYDPTEVSKLVDRTWRNLRRWGWVTRDSRLTSTGYGEV